MPVRGERKTGAAKDGAVDRRVLPLPNAPAAVVTSAPMLYSAHAKRCGLTILAALAVTVSGCSTVRRARDAQDTAKTPAGERTVRAAEIGLDTNTVLTLDRALEIALRYHPSIVRAQQALEAAEAQLRSAGAARKPSVDTGAGYTRRTSNSEASRGSSKSSDSYSASADLDLLIYDFGRTPAAIRQAAERRLAAEQDWRAAKSDAAFAVRTAFYDLGKARELEQVAAEAVRQFEAHLAQVRSFAEVGQRIRYDVTKAEVDVGNARLSLIDARNSVATSRAALNQSLGLAEGPDYRVASGTGAEVPGTTEALMAVARERHPELRALHAQERAASAAVDAAIADLYPALRLRGSYGWSGAALPLVWNWSAGLNATLSLLDGGRRTAQIDDSVAALRSSRARVAEREQQIYLELSRAFSVRDTARQRLELADLIEREARDSLSLVNERYRVGKASAVEVTDAQVAVSKAQADQVKARFDVQLATAQILHAIGGELP